MKTLISHAGEEAEDLYLSFAFSISVEPQRNLFPYIKAFESSIMSAHIRYYILHKYCIQIFTKHTEQAITENGVPGNAKLQSHVDVLLRACRRGSHSFHSPQPLDSNIRNAIHIYQSQILYEAWEHYEERNEPGRVGVIDNDPQREQILKQMRVDPRIPD